MCIRDRHGTAGSVHLKGIEAAQRKIAQYAHARMMECQAYVEHNGRYAPLAQVLAGFLQGLARAAEDELCLLYTSRCV